MGETPSTLRPQWEGTQTAVGKKHAEEGAAETKCFELITAALSPPTLVPTMLLRGGGRRLGNERMKLSVARREGCEQVLLVLSLFITILHYF